MTLHPSDIELQRLAFGHEEAPDARVQRHVEACERCGMTVRYLRALQWALRRADGSPAPVPAATIQRVLRTLRGEDEERR